MSNAADILEMIKAVDPSDTAKLDEIDARVAWYREPLAGYTLRQINGELRAVKDGQYAMKVRPPQYTRSRDALKAIRPEGWQFVIDLREGNASVCFAIDCDHQKLGEWFTATTEELAELHAIIQAIDYERQHDKN